MYICIYNFNVVSLIMLLSLRKSHAINCNTYQDVFLYWHVPILLLFVILDGIDATLFSIAVTHSTLYVQQSDSHLLTFLIEAWKFNII